MKYSRLLAAWRRFIGRDTGKAEANISNRYSDDMDLTVVPVLNK